MQIVINIPSAFIDHFHNDRFYDALMRLSSDAHLLAGQYEKETAAMLIKAFEKAVEIPAHGDLIDREELEEEIDFSLQQVNTYLDNLDADYYSSEYRKMEARAECYRDALEYIRDAPTVIPREEET